MQKISKRLLTKFGYKYKDEVDELVSNWFLQSYPILNSNVSLKDINEMAIARTLEYAINIYGLGMSDLHHVAVLPALANNKCDLQVKIILLPEVIERKLAPFIVLEYGFWTEKDKFSSYGSTEHILVVKGQDSDKIEGMYLNGTVIESGEQISIYYTKSELGPIFKKIDLLLNGIKIKSEMLKMAIAIQGLFNRFLESDIGFMLSLYDSEIYDLVNKMVMVGEHEIYDYEFYVARF